VLDIVTDYDSYKGHILSQSDLKIISSVVPPLNLWTLREKSHPQEFEQNEPAKRLNLFGAPLK